MGSTDFYIKPWYKEHIEPKGEVALLGFSNNDFFNGDLYDLSLGNWNINDNWSLNKKYDTIICIRCAYFAKHPKNFISKCMDHLKKSGTLYVDWGLGDHWRFENYKIGWIKDGEHEYAYTDDNFLWSTVWSHKFLDDPQFKIFESNVKKFGYNDVKSSIFKEVPRVLNINTIKNFKKVNFNIISIWEDLPQLYILLTLQK